ncbi:MAG: D-alanine--poly(phosphoribitol) ligase, partial [Bacteroidota bacterium]
VELGAIERALLEEPMVVEAVVIALPGAEDTLRLLAAVVLQNGANITTRDLTQRLRTTFPPYAVPESIYLRATLPRTGSGKVDRPALANLLEEPDQPTI